MTRTSATRAFTLTELLVSIGILALLAGLLLPAFQSMKLKAKGTTGLGNMRQIGLAFISYASENNGNLATTQTVAGNSSEYMIHLAPYMGYNNVTSLPNIKQAPIFFSPLYSGKGGPPWPWNYTFNERYSPKNNSGWPIKISSPKVEYNSAWQKISPVDVRASIENASTYLLRDCVSEYNAANPQSKAPEWPRKGNLYLFLDGHAAFHDMTDTSPAWATFP